MIHIFKEHYKKGSYTPWYDLLSIDEEHIFHTFSDTEDFENAWGIYEDENNIPIDSIDRRMENIEYHDNDIIILDSVHIPNQDSHTFHSDVIKSAKKISEKYKCKFVFFEDDNALHYEDTEFYTFFSNVFQVKESNKNCNYYRYRAKHQEYFKHIEPLLNIFLENIRFKKCNFIVGVDKIERLEIFKYFHNINLIKDSWVGYSGFASIIDDSMVNDGLLHFREQNVPTILDISFERSQEGNVNVEIPPIPTCITSYFSCICETQIIFGEGSGIHLSEKAFNPFISYNIPLILGSQDINKYLKNEGFWLAEDLFDLTPQKTHRDILEQYKRNLDVINEMSMEEIHSYYMKNIDNIKMNFNKIKYSNFKYKTDNYKLPQFTSVI